MKSSVPSTSPSTPDEYIASLEEPRRGEIKALHDLIEGEAPALESYVANGMLAYGRYHYRYRTGREGDTFLIGVASNRRYISLYVNAADPQTGYLAESYRERLPKADIGRSCVRIKRLADIDQEGLGQLIREGAAWGWPDD